MRNDIDYSKYAGQWVVVCNNKVVAHAKDLSKIKTEIKNCKATPELTRVPEEGIHIFYGDNS
jgi:hypothetical protein